MKKMELFRVCQFVHSCKGSIFVTFIAFALILLASIWSLSAEGTQAPPITDIKISSQFFNPTLGNHVEYSFIVHEAGQVNASMIDRDGYVVQRLMKDAWLEPGVRSLSWRGYDIKGAIVPDESWSLRLEWKAGGKSFTYFPASETSKTYAINANYYDKASGILSYTTQRASRMQCQLGLQSKDEKTGMVEGPVLLTLVNRAPRGAGWVVEQWNGYLNNGFFLAGKKNFVVAVAASDLPQNSAISGGNRSRTFAQYATERKGVSQFSRHSNGHIHHESLGFFDDLSPDIDIEVKNGSHSKGGNVWSVDTDNLNLICNLKGANRLALHTPSGRTSCLLGYKARSEDTETGRAGL